jgi:hypothetical protein
LLENFEILNKKGLKTESETNLDDDQVDDEMNMSEEHPANKV